MNVNNSLNLIVKRFHICGAGVQKEVTSHVLIKGTMYFNVLVIIDVLLGRVQLCIGFGEEVRSHNQDSIQLREEGEMILYTQYLSPHPTLNYDDKLICFLDR